MVARRQRGFDRELVLRRPLGPLFADDVLQLEEVGQGNGAGGGGDVEGGVGGEAEEGAELAGEGRGEVVPGGVVVEDAFVGGCVQVGAEGHGTAELLDFVEVATLEVGEFPPGVL